MQFLSGIASLLTRPPPTTDPRSDPSASPDTFASHGGEEVEEPEGMSGIRTTGAPLNVPLNARIGNTTVSFSDLVYLHARQQHLQQDHVRLWFACLQKDY